MEKFYLGIDASKGFADFTILDSNSQIVLKNFELGDNFLGHCELVETLYKFMEERDEAKLYAALESTGGYENNWYNTLFKCQREIEISVARLNPLGVHFSIKANMQRNITDKISAYSIADYLIKQGDKIRYDVDTYYAELRKHKKFIDMVIKQKVQTENQLESVLYSANPELLVYCKKRKPSWLFKLLLQYPTADKLKRAHLESLKKLPYMKDKLAEQIFERAKKSVSSSSGQLTETLIKEMVTQIINNDAIIDKHKKIMADNCKLDEVELLKSFPGIGEYSAISLILEIGLIERFKSPKQLACYFGVHPKSHQSGDMNGVAHMSKQGRSAPRAVLYMVAFSAIVHNSVIKEVYANNKKKGMSSKAAMGVCMHKILRIVYGMLKTNQRFDPLIDKRNQEKSEKIKTGITVVKDKQFHNIMSTSPISKRQYKKRMAQLEPQDAVTSNAGSMN
jgi:transposase